MCDLVSRVSLSHGQVMESGERGRKEWPVRHWSNLPNSSRLPLRALKWWVWFRNNLTRLAMAKQPEAGALFHSCYHWRRLDLLARLLALTRDRLKGVWHSSDVASLASSSALSLPAMSQWLGHHETVMERSPTRRGTLERVWWFCGILVRRFERG